MIDEATKQAYAEYEKNGGSFRKLATLLKWTKSMFQWRLMAGGIMF